MGSLLQIFLINFKPLPIVCRAKILYAFVNAVTVQQTYHKFYSINLYRKVFALIRLEGPNRNITFTGKATTGRLDHMSFVNSWGYSTYHRMGQGPVGFTLLAQTQGTKPYG